MSCDEADKSNRVRATLATIPVADPSPRTTAISGTPLDKSNSRGQDSMQSIKPVSSPAYGQQVHFTASDATQSETSSDEAASTGDETDKRLQRACKGKRYKEIVAEHGLKPFKKERKSTYATVKSNVSNSTEESDIASSQVRKSIFLSFCTDVLVVLLDAADK